MKSNLSKSFTIKMLDLIWPCCKVGQCQPRINIGNKQIPMLHTMALAYWHFGSRSVLKVVTIIGSGGHLVHVNRTI